MSKTYDLVIIGAGSGNMLPSDDMAGWRIAVVEPDRFGGTCLNRGCIPSKMFVYAADVANTVRQAERYGINAKLLGADWVAIRDRVFGRIDPIHQHAVDFRRRHGADVYLQPTRFVAPKILQIGNEQIEAERVVIAAGSRPAVPPIPGLADVSFHTSDTIMRLDRLPASMIVLGGGFIAAEMSHVFGAYGTQVTIVNRGPTLLANADHEIRERFTAAYAERFDLRLNATIERVEQRRRRVAVTITRENRRETIEAETLLVALGRVSNADLLDLAAGGLHADEHGHVVTDDTYATSVPGVWALGDVANHFQLKHMANAEARLVRHNMLNPSSPRRSTFGLVPAAVFADPQVASVGATEEQLAAAGATHKVARREYSAAAYGWALEDTTSMVKLLSDPTTGLLLGAHIIGPQASTLIQPLLQAMTLGNTVTQLATETLYIHPALTEVVEQALLDLL